MSVCKRAIGVIAAVLMCIALSACTRMIRGPADELQMYRWSAVTDNGNTLGLQFDDKTATFTAENGSFTLHISGVFLIDDTTLVISDIDTRMNYSFTYLLHGDSVELTYGDGTLRLQKIIL